MSDKRNSGFGLNAKFFFVLLGTLIPLSISLWLLSIVPFGSPEVKGPALLLSGVCFFLGSFALLFSRPTKEKGLLWLSGFIVTIGAVVFASVEGLFQIVLLYPNETLAVVSLSFTYLITLYFLRAPVSKRSPPLKQEVGISISRMVMKKKFMIGAVELAEFPEEHLRNKETDLSHYQPFYNILRVMILANFPVALRYERVRNKMRVLYLTWAKDDVGLSENIGTLADTVKGNLSGFKRKIHTRFHGPTIDSMATAVTSYLLREPLSIEVPRQRKDAMTVMADVLLGMPGGVIQISAIPKRSSNRAVKALEKQYRAESERSQLTISKARTSLLSGEVQESKTRTDMGAVRKADSLQRQITRLSNSHLCEVEVSATCWAKDPQIAERDSRKLIGVLRGTLIPADPECDLSIETRNKTNETSRLIEGELIGKTTLLSLDEASVYFSIPRNDLGISVADHASFHTKPAKRRSTKPDQSTKKSDFITLGKLLDDSGTPIDDFKIQVIDLASHIVIGGDIGNGKTVTQSNITMELNRVGINFLEILASKHEDHLQLTRKIKGIRVFTPGDETATPVRFSFTDFCKAMHINSIINDTKVVFVAAMPSHGIIKEYMETVIELTFKRLGWDRNTNTPGLPILLTDFLETLPLIKEDIQYSSRGNEDVWGALYGRFNTLSGSVLNSIFGTTSGLTIKELVSRPTMIVLDRLSHDEQSFFVYWLVSRVARYFEAQKKTEPRTTKGLKYLVVLEEAHRFLSGGRGVKVEEEHGALRAAINTITTTMKESRSAGLGFCLITPDLSKLTNEACTMALNIVMHGKGARDDRKLIGDQMNCTEDQIRMIGSLPIGEAVIRTASISKPVRVKINKLDFTSDAPVTDEDLQKHMKPIYEQNPHFKAKADFSPESLKLKDLNEGLSSIRIDLEGTLRLYAFCNSPTFPRLVENLMEITGQGKARLAALNIRNLAKHVASNEASLSFYSYHLVRIISELEVSEEILLEKIVIDLERLLSFSDMESVRLERYHERLRMEVEKRLEFFKYDSKELSSTMLVVLRQALDEYRNPPPVDSVSDNQVVGHKSNLEEMVETVVKTDQFASRYVERTRIAVEGNVEPLVRLLITFARNIAGPGADIIKIATLLLHYAQSILDSPDDEKLWSTVHHMVQTEITDSGSEVAA